MEFYLSEIDNGRPQGQGASQPSASAQPPAAPPPASAQPPAALQAPLQQQPPVGREQQPPESPAVTYQAPRRIKTWMVLAAIGLILVVLGFVVMRGSTGGVQYQSVS